MYWDMLGLAANNDPCCKTGTRERSKECYIYIRVGHSNNIEKNPPLNKLTPCDRQAFVTCNQLGTNRTIKNGGILKEENYYPNSNRSDDLIFPNDNKKDIKTVLEAYNDEMLSAKEEATRMCKQKCCFRIVIKTLYLDRAGENWINKHKKETKTRMIPCES